MTPPADPGPTRLLTARHVAEMLGMSRETVLRWTRRGEFDGVAIHLPGGAVRYREDRVEAWIEQRTAREQGSATRPAGRRLARLTAVNQPNSEEV